MICICDAPTDRPGLCARCASSPALLRAFREGVERQRPDYSVARVEVKEAA